jgi:hypothetical protein
MPMIFLHFTLLFITVPATWVPGTIFKSYTGTGTYGNTQLQSFGLITLIFAGAGMTPHQLKSASYSGFIMQISFWVLIVKNAFLLVRSELVRFCYRLIKWTFVELPAGQITEFLVGFTNKGEQEMILDSMEASLRYHPGTPYRNLFYASVQIKFCSN